MGNLEKNKEKVSVVIPTFNRAQYLLEAIDSVFAQTYRNFEIIVVDDGSTDCTSEVLKKYGSKIISLHQENAGVSAARNFGTAHATGNFIAFLDSDDIWFPDKLERYLQVFWTHPEYRLLTGNMAIIDKDGKHFCGIKPTVAPGDDFESLIERGSGMCSTIMIRREILDEIPGKLFDEELCCFEDLELCIRVASKCRMFHFDLPLAYYRLHQNSFVNQIASYSSQVKFWEKMRGSYRPLLNLKLKTSIRRRIIAISYELCRSYLGEKRYIPALLYFLKTSLYLFLF
jgi:glycosyltransferase involved in cell wall biosynthesis